MNTHPLNAVSGTEFAVCLDIQQRQQHGITKYNTTVANNPLPLREWLQHGFEEMLDGAIYLKRAMEKMDAEREQILAERQNIENVKATLLNLARQINDSVIAAEIIEATKRLPAMTDWPKLSQEV